LKSEGWNHFQDVKMLEETREEIVSELRAYKVANPNWITNVKMAQVVASYNNRLAAMSPGVNLIGPFPSP
jgi:hypothetical protein